MAFQKFIKENIALTVGITLPILLIVVFSLATVIPKYTTPPPQYEMIFSVSEYQNNPTPDLLTDFKVKNGKIQITTFKKQENYNNRRVNKIYVFNGAKESIREIVFDIPTTEGTTILKETKSFDINNESKSPDGYSFISDRYSSGLMQDVFIGGRSRNHAKIEKGMAAYKIPNMNKKRYYSHNIQFLGWIIPNQEQGE